MSQPTAKDEELMLSPPFPHELTLMILKYLELSDLVALYCLNSYWKTTFDNDEVIRLKMFRLPREMKYSAQVKWVQEQWKKTYKKTEGSDQTPEDFWKHIRVNPYLISGPYREVVERREDTINGTYVMYKDPYTFSAESLLSEGFPDRYLDLPKDHENRATDLIDSMFVSYPPVTRTELYSYSIRLHSLMRTVMYPIRKFSESWEESTGYKMGQVYEIAQRQPEDFPPYNIMVRLWPEMLWRIKHGISPEDDEEGEAGQSDDVTGGVGVSEQNVVEDNAEDNVKESGADELAGNGNVSDGDSTVEEDEEDEESEDDEGSEYEPESGSDDSD